MKVSFDIHEIEGKEYISVKELKDNDLGYVNKITGCFVMDLKED